MRWSPRSWFATFDSIYDFQNELLLLDNFGEMTWRLDKTFINVKEALWELGFTNVHESTPLSEANEESMPGI